MVAIITGDIIASRKLIDQGVWLNPLKDLFKKWGNSIEDWSIVRGDSFQVELLNAEEVLIKALEIKALIKAVEPLDKNKKNATIDVRLAIGLGLKTYYGDIVSESNGSAYINSGEKFDILEKENVTLGIKTPWKTIDEEMNLYFKLISVFMDNWSVSSAELMKLVLQNPKMTQVEIGKQLGIKQNSVSGRWSRAKINEILEVEQLFRKKIKDVVV